MLRRGLRWQPEYGGFTTLLAQLMIQRGWASVHLGTVEEGFDEIGRGMAIMPPTVGVPRHLFRRFLAEVYLLAKRADDGLRVVSEDLRDWEGGKRHMDHAELHQLRGDLLLLQNASDATEAESCFRDAIEIAQRQQAKSWELRATMSLARLLRDAGRRDEARNARRNLRRFTEGFDTADLKDAKALLDELSA
jgi:predicted ATPase